MLSAILYASVRRLCACHAVGVATSHQQCYEKGFFPSYLYSINLNLAISSHAGEGNGTRLQYSCLENPMDGGAW